MIQDRLSDRENHTLLSAPPLRTVFEVGSIDLTHDGNISKMSRVLNVWRKWQDAALYPVQRLPTALQFPVNDICNSHCQMCHIWKQKRDYEMGPDEVRRVLANPLFREVKSVGINGGEPTLRSDLGLVVAAVVETLPKLVSVALITNGIRSSQCIQAIETIGGVCKNANKHLDVMVSLDGVGDVHDRVRGVKGNFESAVRVIDHVRSSKVVSSCRIGCTIVSENVFDLENVLVFAKQKPIYARFRLGIPHPRLYTGSVREPFDLSPKAHFHATAFLETLIQEYERDPIRRGFYRSLRDQLAYSRPRKAGCVWKNHGVTLGPRGELAYCAVASPTLGNARETSADDLYWNKSEELSAIIRTKCADCRHDYEGSENRRTMIRRWMGRMVRKLPETERDWVYGGIDRFGRGREWVDVLFPHLFDRHIRSRPTRMTVLLCGWYGTETLGDRAILAGLCDLIKKELPEWSVDVASLEPYVTKETCRIMPELNIREVIDLSAAMTRTAAGMYSIVAVAGGPLMTPVREIIELNNLLEEGRRSGSVTALLGCGIGPISSSGARRFVLEKMVKNADLCVFRDLRSESLARKFGRTVRTIGSIDPAFFWSVLKEKDESRTAEPIIVAVALRDWPLSEYVSDVPKATAGVLKAQFESELEKMIGALMESGSVRIVPVCMHTLAIGGDDRMFYERLFRFRPELAALISWIRRDPHEELELLRRAHAVVAMRFHSCVFSIALQKPFVALDYTRGGKIDSLMKETANEDRLIDLASFDGRKVAIRLLEDVKKKNSPERPSAEEGEKIYRQALRWLAKGLGLSRTDFLSSSLNEGDPFSAQ